MSKPERTSCSISLLYILFSVLFFDCVTADLISSFSFPYLSHFKSYNHIEKRSNLALTCNVAIGIARDCLERKTQLLERTLTQLNARQVRQAAASYNEFLVCCTNIFKYYSIILKIGSLSIKTKNFGI